MSVLYRKTTTVYENNKIRTVSNNEILHVLLLNAPHAYHTRRGFYAGPVGYLSAVSREFGVAIRSALVTTTSNASGGVGGGGGLSSSSEMTLFAGAGIVPGSTAISEWAETGVKVCTDGFFFSNTKNEKRQL